MRRSRDRRRIPVGPPPTPTHRLPDHALNVKALFDRHYDELYRYVARLTGDPDLAADIAQEAFIRWVERKPESTEPRAWLYKVATNLCRDHVRVESRRLELLQETPESTPVGSAPADPATSLETAERQRAVRAVLDALPEKERTILLMQQEGFSHREIAEAVGTTTGSVGTMLARALRRFAEQAQAVAEVLR